MADVIAKFKLETTQFDSKLRDTAKELQAIARQAEKGGKDFNNFSQKAIESARALGTVQSGAKNTKDKLRDLVGAYNDASKAYNKLSDKAKQGEFGKAMQASLQKLQHEIKNTKKELYEMGDTKKAGIDFNSALGQLGSKLGINSELMGMLTTGTIAYTAAIGAAATAVAYAAKEWAAYNSELSKQQQITGVTTGLNGADADNMTAAARAISRVYGTDFREVINAANTLMTQFGETGNEAIRLLKDGMQGMINGDGGKLLQMIQQYAPAFRDAGVSASQLIAVIQNSEGGIFTSENMNAIVMGIKNIRLMTNATSEALGKLGIDGQKMSKDLSDGTITIFDALKKVAESIDNVGSGSQAAGEVMQTVFGRQGAMAGTKLGEAIASLNLNLDETKGQTGELGESLQRLTDETEKFEKKLMDIAGFDGWDAMTNDIETGVLISLNETLDSLKAILHQLNGIAGIDLNATNMAKWFTDMITYCYELINPLAGVVHLLGFIGKGTGGGSTGSGNQLSPEMQRVYNLADHGTPENSVGDVVVTYTRPTTTTKTPRGGRGSGKVETVYDPTSIAYQQKVVQELTKAYDEASEAERDYKKQLLDEAKLKLDIMTGRTQVRDAIGTTDEGIQAISAINFEDIVGNLISDIKLRPFEQGGKKRRKSRQEIAEEYGQNATVVGAASDLTNGVNGILNGIEQMGVEIPKELKGIMSGINSVMTILTSINTILGVIEGLQTVGVLPFFANSGIVPHAANGYYVPGNHYSGDVTPVMADAGELILNRAAQGNLVSQLQNNGGRIQVHGVLHGEDIILSANRTYKRKGQGEIVTW